jgi:PDZ domain
MRRTLAAVAAALWILPLQAQTSGPSGIPGVESDEFSMLMKINGAVESDNPVAGIFKTWRLRSFVSKRDGTAEHQIYVTLRYHSLTSRNHFNSASDETAAPLTVKTIASNFEYGCSKKAFSYGCNNSEHIGIDVTANVLRAHAATGYRIKISAKSGDSFIIVVSPNQIAAQLDTTHRCFEYLHAQGSVAENQRGPQVLNHSQLGFKASEITDEIAAKTGLPKGSGIVVFEVAPGSIAERSGLKVLDRIMAVAGCGQSMDSQAAMRKCIGQKTAYIGMVVDRGGALATVGMKLYAQGR